MHFSDIRLCLDISIRYTSNLTSTERPGNRPGFGVSSAGGAEYG